MNAKVLDSTSPKFKKRQNSSVHKDHFTEPSVKMGPAQSVQNAIHDTQEFNDDMIEDD